MSKTLISVLEQSELFAGFVEEQLEQVILQLQPKIVTLKSGDRLYKRGESADRCWLLLSGDLAVKRVSLRSPLRHMIYHIGSVTGIQGLADPGSARQASLIAEKRSELIEITHEGIDRLDAETQVLLWKNVSRLLLRKLSVCLAKQSFDD
jgi:CRP-like cAMP-binding protein